MNFLKMLRAMARTVTGSKPGDGGNSIVSMAYPLSGVRVDEHVALTYSAVYACVRVISETLATLPWRVYAMGSGDDRRRLASNPVDVLLRNPNPEMTGSVFRETLQSHALLWGNGYAEIERTRGGDPVALWPLLPDRTEPDRDSMGNIVYECQNAGGGSVTLPASDVFHLRGLGFDGLRGYSIIRLARESVGLGLALEKFGAAFFGNGATPGLVLEHPGKLSQEARDHLKESTDSTHRGVGRAHSTFVAEEGMKVSKTSIPPEEAQFLESMRFRVVDVCRWYGVPPHMVGDLDRATFSNIEHQAIEFVVRTLTPWAVRSEQEADRKLLRDPSGRTFTKTAFQALLRGDSAARAKYYRDMSEIGVLSINEIRGFEELNAVEGGDLRTIQLNRVDIEQAGDPDPAPTGRPGQAAALRRVFVATAERLIRKETNAAKRAAGKTRPAFCEWVATFYAAHVEHVRESFAAPMLALGELVAGEDLPTAERIAAAAVVFAESHAARASARLLEVPQGDVADACLAWSANLPAQMAADVTEATLAAVGVNGAAKP